MRAEMLAYSHSRGVFAGIALQGATLRDDTDENKALYGSAMSNKEIVTGTTSAPPSAQDFMTALSKLLRRPGLFFSTDGSSRK